MKREFSAGGIVFNDKGEVLLCKPSGHEYWLFPKGRIKEKEKSQEAALREVKEETGADCEIIGKVGENRYVYTAYDGSGEKIFKVVTVYLMRYLDGDIQDHDWEMEEVMWVSVEKALEMLSFKSDKELLAKAVALGKDRSNER